MENNVTALRFNGLFLQDDRSISFDPQHLAIAGWTGRNRDDVEEHIRELEKLGVSRPSKIPTFYEVPSALLTQESHITVAGTGSSGEAECVLLVDGAQWWVGIGSDHTDRELERQSVNLSKQACPKPIGRDIWRYEDVANHWDRLELTCHATRGGERRLYQQGSVAALLPPADLLTRYHDDRGASGLVMFCGTLPVIGQIKHADRYEVELCDPVLDREIQHAYTVCVQG